MKAFQSLLWMAWLCGFLLIAVSFYATTQILPSTTRQYSMTKSNSFNYGNTDSRGPQITIFTAPKPFAGSVGERQALAVRSWLGLSSDISVVLFSQDPSVFSFAGALGSRVSVEPNIDFTFLGSPFFHSIVARSQTSTSDISVLVDPDIILLPNLISTLNHASKLDHDWLLVASSRNVSHFPFHMDSDGKHWLADDGKQIRTEKVRKNHIKIQSGWPMGQVPLNLYHLPSVAGISFSSLAVETV